MQLPCVSDAELLEAIKWKIKDELPFELEKAVFDYQIIKKSSLNDGSKVFDLACIAALEEEITSQVVLLKQAGLNVIGVGFAPFGYIRLIEKYLAEDKGAAQAVLYLWANASYLNIYKDNKLVFFRELPVSLNKFRNSLSAALVTEKGKVQLSPLQIEDILFKHGVPIPESGLYNDKTMASQIMAMWRPALEALAQEIKRSFVYYKSQFQEEDAGKIFVAAEAQNIINLDKFLAKELSSEAEVFPVIEKILPPPQTSPSELVKIYPGIGLAIDYKHNINLLPRQFRTEKIENVQKISLRWVAFIAFLLLAVSYILARAGVTAYEKRLDRTLFQLNVLSEIKNIKNKLDAFEIFSAGVKDRELPLGEIFKKISNISPREMFFNSLVINCGSKTGSISGYVKTTNQNADSILTQFISQLNSSKMFFDVNLSELKKTGTQGFDLANFEISFRIK
ncbi:MAG: hypothetical protein FJZ15_00565 [Candidatus Omnitrophica bacterium]|nr:hypothetical protein [Candidatus Omnitrophota bacterium]